MKQVNIQNIAIPIGEIESKYFEAPDLEPAFNYYPSFLRYAKDKISPAEYLNKILAIIIDTGEKRNRILSSFSYYLGSEFREKMEQYHEMYEAFKETK